MDDSIDQTMGAEFASDENPQLLLRDAYLHHQSLKPQFYLESEKPLLRWMIPSPMRKLNLLFFGTKRPVSWEQDSWAECYESIFDESPPSAKDPWADYFCGNIACDRCGAKLDTVDDLGRIGLCGGCEEIVTASRWSWSGGSSDSQEWSDEDA